MGPRTDYFNFPNRKELPFISQTWECFSPKTGWHRNNSPHFYQACLLLRVTENFLLQGLQHIWRAHHQYTCHRAPGHRGLLLLRCSGEHTSSTRATGLPDTRVCFCSDALASTQVVWLSGRVFLGARIASELRPRHTKTWLHWASLHEFQHPSKSRILCSTWLKRFFREKLPNSKLWSLRSERGKSTRKHPSRVRRFSR